MLRDGIIEYTTTPFSSVVVVVGMKDGEYHFCVDYSRLNNRTVDAPQCLPCIHETLKDLESAKIFLTLDLKSGYWQIPKLLIIANARFFQHLEGASNQEISR